MFIERIPHIMYIYTIKRGSDYGSDLLRCSKAKQRRVTLTFVEDSIKFFE